MLLETALKDYLSLPCRVSPGPLPSQGGETLHPEKHSETPQFPQRGSRCVGHPKCVALPTASHSMSPTPATAAHRPTPSVLLFWPNFYQKPGWNDTTEGWSEKTCGPSISLLGFISDSSQTRKLVHTVIILHQFTWNGFALCFQWAKFKFLSPSLCVRRCVCVCISIYILQIYIYIFGVYYINWWWPLREAPIETFWGTI